jgi:hypothetical protein
MGRLAHRIDSGPSGCYQHPSALTTDATSSQEVLSMAAEQPTAARPFFKPLPEHDTLNTAYFLARVAERVKPAANGCWLWTGNSVRGYGRVDYGGKKLILHRLIFGLCVGPVRGRIEVCHNCPGGDNPACVNPAHLFLGTHVENMRDSEQKGRNSHPGQQGEEKSQAKLTDEAVRDIRRRAANGPWGIKKQLAQEYGVSQACISEVINRKKWGHVPDEAEGGTL